MNLGLKHLETEPSCSHELASTFLKYHMPLTKEFKTLHC